VSPRQGLRLDDIDYHPSNVGTFDSLFPPIWDQCLCCLVEVFLLPPRHVAEYNNQYTWLKNLMIKS